MFKKKYKKNFGNVHFSPIVVGKNEAEAALNYLQTHTGIDMYSFMQEVDAETLLKEPLGSTDDCLSVDEIASYDSLLQPLSEKDEFSTVRDIRALDHHLSICEECQKNLKLYRALELQTKELPESEIEQHHLIAYICDEKVVDMTPESGIEYACNVVLRGGPPGADLTVDPSTVLLRESILSPQTNPISVRSQSMEPGVSSTFSASFQISCSERLEREVHNICDWLEICGKTTSGYSFSARYQGLMKQEDDVTLAVIKVIQ